VQFWNAFVIGASVLGSLLARLALSKLLFNYRLVPVQGDFSIRRVDGTAGINERLPNFCGS